MRYRAQEALAQALGTVLDYPILSPDAKPRTILLPSWDEMAAAILDALPEGWLLVDLDVEASEFGPALIHRIQEQERERLRPILDAVWSWHRAEKHHRTLDATTDDAAWNDAMVATVDALNILRDTLDILADPENDFDDPASK